MLKRKRLWVVLLFLILVGSVVWSQPGRRRHKATQAKPLSLVPATEQPNEAHESKIEQADGGRHVASNGIPNHKVGRFPNAGNPNSIRPQRYHFKLPDQPKPTEEITSIYYTSRFGPPNMPFGVAVNGILFDPGTAEFWLGDRTSGWNYEALGGAVRLGLDENFAHVQPSGSYHYHGIPQPLLSRS